MFPVSNGIKKGKSPSVFQREKDGFYAIWDNKRDPGQLGNEADPDIYFHGHTLGFQSEVQVPIELFSAYRAELATLITKISKLEQDSEKAINLITDSSVSDSLESLIRHTRLKLNQIARLNKSSNSSFEKELTQLSIALETYENTAQKISNFTETSPSSIELTETLFEVLEHLTHFIKRNRIKNKNRTKTIDKTKNALSVPGAHIEKEDAICDTRFGDVAFLKVAFPPASENENKQASLRLAYFSSRTQNGPITSREPICFVFANCIFASMLQGDTTEHDTIAGGERVQKNVQIIDHNLQAELLDQVVIKLTHHPEWSPYELVMFAQLEKQLDYVKILSDGRPFTLIYHLPDIGYKLSGLKLFLDDKLPGRKLGDYIKAVNERSSAHHAIVEGIVEQSGLSTDLLTIESPFNNLDFEALIDRHTGIYSESTERDIVDDVLQQLITNDLNPVHQEAWAKVLPETTIEEARSKIDADNTALSPAYERLNAIQTVEDLIHLANSMMIAIAHQAEFDNQKTDFKVVPFHSYDEKPISAGYGRFLAEIFGEIEAIHVLPDFIYYGDEFDNNMFRVTPDSVGLIKEDLQTCLIKHYAPSEFLQDVILKDNIYPYCTIPHDSGRMLKSNSTGSISYEQQILTTGLFATKHVDISRKNSQITPTSECPGPKSCPY